MAFSKHVSGVCGFDSQPWRCAATRFPGDVLLPQTHQSSVPHCFGCPDGTTISYDHCKAQASFVNTSLLAAAAAAVPTCSDGAAGGGDCIDDVAHLARSKVFLTRGECRTYTGSAVANTRDVYAKLGASGLAYFDQCNPDGSHKHNDTTAMCLEHVFGSTAGDGGRGANPLHNFLFPQAPFVTDFDAGFGELGFAYVPAACEGGAVACGVQVRFHGCGEGTPPDPQTQAFAEKNNIILLGPNVPGQLPWTINGNNATEHCNAGTSVSGNCKEISRGCWDGYGQLSAGYYLQSAAHMLTVWRMVEHLSNGSLGR